MSDEQFQSAYAKAGSFTSKLSTEQKQPCLCEQQINRDKKLSEIDIVTFLEVLCSDMKPRFIVSVKKRDN